MLLILAGCITVMGYSKLQGSCYHAISTCPHFSLNACDSLPALCLCQLLFLKVCEPDIKTRFYMSLNSTILSFLGLRDNQSLVRGCQYVSIWGVYRSGHEKHQGGSDYQTVVEGIVWVWVCRIFYRIKSEPSWVNTALMARQLKLFLHWCYCCHPWSIEFLNSPGMCWF